MKVFLCGGGSADQTIEAYKRLNEVIDDSKPCLYIPLAMEYEMYDSCYEWICGELKKINIPSIDMVRSMEELAAKNMSDYAMIFIGGGNTFKLLNDLKVSDTFDKIKRYIHQGGVIFGGSAGAIIFGKDLKACQLDDENTVNLIDTSGFDILNGASILCHYTNRSKEKDEGSKRYLLELSKHSKVVALPEEVTLFINHNSIEVIGDRPFYYFENGQMKIFHTISSNIDSLSYAHDTNTLPLD